MEEMNLTDLEMAANQAYKAYNDAREAAQAAEEKITAAEEAYDEALDYFFYAGATPEHRAAAEAAEQALMKAKEEQKAAEQAVEAAADNTQAAIDAVEAKKEELRTSSVQDTTFVVHCARIECSKGMRDSYLALGPTHGVLTRQIPQLTAKDTILNMNIINFGGCHSMENPAVIKAAEEAVFKARETINGIRDWRDIFFNTIPLYFIKKQSLEMTEGLIEQCVGECIAQFPKDAQWTEGHEKVFINGEPVLMRRCNLMCNYGGQITILVSGQPE